MVNHLSPNLHGQRGKSSLNRGLSAEVADLAARLAAEVATQLEGMLEPTVPLHRQGDMSNVYVACTRHGLSGIDANGLVGRLPEATSWSHRYQFLVPPLSGLGSEGLFLHDGVVIRVKEGPELVVFECFVRPVE
jgi:hypothetical protein